MKYFKSIRQKSVWLLYLPRVISLITLVLFDKIKLGIYRLDSIDSNSPHHQIRNITHTVYTATLHITKSKTISKQSTQQLSTSPNQLHRPDSIDSNSSHHQIYYADQYCKKFSRSSQSIT